MRPAAVARDFADGSSEPWSASFDVVSNWRCYVMAMLNGAPAFGGRRVTAVRLRTRTGQLLVVKPRAEGGAHGRV